ncbi:hypothetical protein DDF62_06840 [Caulobacter radicis]|nr:hypothetical protein DDF62_06840 [Caulobacter radicis]
MKILPLRGEVSAKPTEGDVSAELRAGWEAAVSSPSGPPGHLPLQGEDLNSHLRSLILHRTQHERIIRR